MTASLKLFLLQCISLGLGVTANFVLLKVTNLRTYGSYVYIINLLSLLLGFCLLGVDTLLVKKVSAYSTLLKKQEIKGLFIFSLVVAIIGSVFTSLFSTELINSIAAVKNQIHIRWFPFALVSLLLLSFTTINQAYLQGLKKIILSQLTDKIIKPLLLILVVGVLFYFQKTILLEELITVQVFAMAIVVIISSIFLKKSGSLKTEKIKPVYEIKRWSATAASFFLISALYVINSRIDIFLLGFYKGNNDIGVYNIALRISEIINFPLMVINFVLMPIVSGFFAKNDTKQMQSLVVRSARATLSMSLPILIFLVIFRKQILSFFDAGLLNGQGALLVLCAGQIINTAFGSVGLLLNMSGNQRFSILSLAISTLLNIVINVTLTPRYGVLGTATATASSLALWNILMYIFVRKKLRLRTTAFGII